MAPVELKQDVMGYTRSTEPLEGESGNGYLGRIGAMSFRPQTVCPRTRSIG
jgi:hypothetical protein